MESRYRRTRRALITIGLVAHLCWLAAFFCLSRGAHAMAAYSAMAGLFFAMMIAPLDPSARQSPGSAVSRWTGRIAFLLVVLWLMDLPELHSLLHAIMREEAFRDLRVTAAVCLWAAGSCFTQWRGLLRCEDRHIHRFLEAGET